MLKKLYANFSRFFIRGILALVGTTLLMGLSVLVIEQLQEAPELTKQTWPAGTFLSHINSGARMATIHRGYVYLHSLDNTTVWDISNPASPEKVDEKRGGANGHRWWKLQDLFYREYEVPEVLGSGTKYIDLSNMLQRTPWTKPAPFPIEENGKEYVQDLETFPLTFDGNNIWDMRKDEMLGIADFSASISQELKFRIGNLLIFSGGGAAVYDIGDPENIRFLDALEGNYTQYTTTYHIWRNYLIFMNGDNSNEGGNNLVAIDFSDPTDLKHGFGVKLEDAPGRYMFFQDEFGFTGRQHNGVKLNLETREVEVRYDTPGHPLSFSDFQWIPLGHMIMASGAESGTGESFFYTHSDELDTNPPYVSFHHPFSDDVNLPLTSVIGFVINETLDDVTINDQTIQVSPLGGEPIAGDVVSTSYDIINFAPKTPLSPNTTYEVKLIEGGIKDVAGNGIEEFMFQFTTGGGPGGVSNESPTIVDLSYGTSGPVQVGTNLTISAEATDADGDPLSYRWDVNDGNGKTEWNSSPQISQTFSEPGIYEVLIQVQDGRGGFSSKSISLIVHESITRDLPTHSTPITLDEKNRKVWLVNPDNNTVSVLDADDLTLIREIKVGADPTSVALDDSGNIWVSCRDEDAIYILDNGGTILKIISLAYGSRPYGIVFNPAGNSAYVSNFGSGTIVQLDATGMTLEKELFLGPTPRALAVTGDGKYLLVTRFISTEKGGECWKVDLSTMSLMERIPIRVDIESQDSGANGRGIPNYIAGVAIQPGDSKASLVAKKDNILKGLKRDGEPLTFEMTVRSAVAEISLLSDQENFAARLDIDNHAQPSAALYNDLGSHLFMAMQGNNRVIVLDSKTGKEIAKHDVGLAPQGMVLDPASGRLFVKNFMDRTVTVLNAKEILEKGIGAFTEVGTINTVGNETLSELILKGKQLFYNAADTRMGMDGYMSCATCHIDGTQDGTTYDFSDRNEGFRNTITLKGRAGTGHGRVHWTANFDEIQDFENDIRLHFNGTGFLQDQEFRDNAFKNPLGAPKGGLSEDLDAISAYLESLDSFDPSPFRKSDGSLTEEGLAGKALFVELECGSCHSGEDFTDSEQGFLHDVGTKTDKSGWRIGKELLGFDAPTLRGIWNTAPYLHDGSAETLTEVFTQRNKENHHGATSTLDETQIGYLVAYLKQIDGNEPAPNPHMHLEVISPLNGADYPLQQSVPLGIETNLEGISKVVYYANGKEVAESSKAPYHILWQPLEWGEYTIQAKVMHQQGKSATFSRESKFTYKRPFNAVMVIGGTEMSEGELTVAAHLEEELGFVVSTIRDQQIEQKVVDSLKQGTTILLISSSIDPEEIGEGLTHIPVPVITWDLFSYRFFRLTGASFGASFGFIEEPQRTISLVNPTHPMAADLQDSATLYQLIQRLPYGDPSSPDAVVIAESQGIPIIFGNKKGDSSFSLSRKVAFPLREDFLHLMTPEGWKLFDAAVKWAIYGGDEESGFEPLTDVRITSPKQNATVPSSFNVEFQLDNFELGPMNSGKGMVYVDIDGKQLGTFFTTDPIPTDNLSEGSHTITLQLANGDWIRRTETHTIEVNVSGSVTAIPKVQILEPGNNAIVSLPFELNYSVENWEVQTGGDFAQLWIDGVKESDLYTLDGFTVDQLSSGFHTVEIRLINADGTPTQTSSEITLFVENQSGNTKPVAVMNASIVEGIGPLLVNFDASSSADPDGDALSYQWDFGDGQQGEGVTVSHTFNAPGNYTVSLTVTDGKGGSDIAIGQIKVSEDLTTSVDPTAGPIGNIQAFPNPVKDKLIIELQNQISHLFDIQLLDLRGNILVNQEIETIANLPVKKTMSVEHLAAGIYFLKINSATPGKEFSKVIRILKN